MPFLSNTETIRPVRNIEPEDEPGPTLGEQVGAAFQIENVIGSYLRDVGDPAMQAYDPTFDVMEHLTDEERTIGSRFSDANSPADVDTIRGQLARERDARRVMGEGPLPELAASALAILGDPTTYLPSVGAISKGGSLVSKLSGAALGGAADVALSEAALQATQRERTFEESAYSVLLGGAFGMGIGAGAAALTAKNAIADGVRDATALSRAVDELDPDSIGAARAEIDPSDTRLEPFVGQTVLDKASRYNFAPVSIQMKTSELDSVRRITDQLVDTGLVTQGNVHGVPTAPSVETKIKRHDAMKAAVGRSSKDFFRQHKAAGGEMRESDFRKAVGGALRRGDAHPDQYVAKAAQWMRANIFDPLKDRAIETGLLPEGVSVKEAASYFTRVYNREKIKAQRPVFKKIISDYIEKAMRAEAWDLEVRRLEEGASEALDTALQEVETRLGRDVADDAAEQIIDKILGNNAARMDFFPEPLGRGPLKERTLHIPDETIEDFLESDSLEVSMRYISTMASDIEMTRAFGRADMENQLIEIQNEANERIARAGTEKERIRIQDEATKQTENIKAMADLLRNRYTDWGSNLGLKRVGRAVRQWNYLRLLGSVTLSSIADVGRVAMEEGVARSFGTLFTDMATGFKGLRMGKAEAQLAGTALDITLATRARSMADLGERYIAESKFERGMSRASDYFGIVNLLSPWNQGMKSWASTVISSRILRTAEKLAKGGKLSRSEKLKLARSGIDEGLARRIANHAEDWERHPNGVILGNTEVWNDSVAVEAFRNALIQDVDRTILTAGVSDRPLWMHSETGKMIGQFKSFAMAAVTKLMASSLQTRDLAALNGLIMIIGFGALATVARDYSKHGESNRSARDLLANGIDRSGALAIFAELNPVMEKTVGWSPLSSLSGVPLERFQTRGIVGQVVGPTAGVVEDTAAALKAFADGEATQKDIGRAVKLMPMSNVFYIRKLLEDVKDASGLPEN